MKLEKADLVIHNAKIYTVNQNFEVAQAMAIKDGKIIAIGKEYEIKNKYRADEFFDAQTQPIYPGFIDAHAHFIGYGLNQLAVNLSEAKSLSEISDKLRTFKKNNPDAKWLIGYGWDENLWESKVISPVRIDKEFSQIPVLLWRKDGHQLLVNNAAVKLAFGDSMTFPEGIVKDANIPAFVNAIAYTKSQIKQAIRIAEEACLKQGLTTVTDAGISIKEAEILKRLDKNGNLDIKIYAMLKPTKENLVVAKKGLYLGDYLTIRSFKLLADGSLGSSSAYLLEPYNGLTVIGNNLIENKELEDLLKQIKTLGYQANVHAIGDAANRKVLQTMGTVLEKQNDLRWRVEHAQMVTPNDWHLFGKFAILPSVQPTHGLSDMELAKQKIGEDRLSYSYLLKTLQKQNGIIAFGTDFPVEPISPIQTFYSAVVRKNSEGKTTKALQKERMSREETLKAMTFWNAMAMFKESEIGSLEVGKQADFVILNRDIMEVSEKELLKTEVKYTFINGYKMFQTND